MTGDKNVLKPISIGYGFQATDFLSLVAIFHRFNPDFFLNLAFKFSIYYNSIILKNILKIEAVCCILKYYII